jgi:hypothetical protein
MLARRNARASFLSFCFDDGRAERGMRHPSSGARTMGSYSAITDHERSLRDRRSEREWLQFNPPPAFGLVDRAIGGVGLAFAALAYLACAVS